MDAKDQIMENAEEIAFKKYESDFYELSEEHQTEVWELAEEQYADQLADLQDSLADRAWEEKMGLW